MENLIGEKIGMLIIISEDEPDIIKYGKYSGKRLTVKCECGKIKSVNKRSVLRGRTASCGCLRTKTITKHGLSGEKLYTIWNSMRVRCHNESSYTYKHYGGRGISVCDEWKDNVRAFFEWAMNSGYEEGLTIDRIDNDGDYSPSNCRFVTLKINANNKRSTIFLNIGNQKISLQDASVKFKLNPDTLYQRIHKLKWDHKKAVSKPVRKKRGH